MKTFSYTITDEVGIHARPAGLLAKKAKEFESVCTIEKGGKSGNITKLLALMGLGVQQAGRYCYCYLRGCRRGQGCRGTQGIF